MAGIEVAGLALGAIPVMLEAIKGYRETYERIQNFKHATRQLQIVDAQFRVCRLNFLSECRLLLDLVVSDPQLSQEMVVNTKHQMWHDASIAEQIDTLLQENINACATIISDTTATISALDSRLTKLRIPPKSASSTIQRTRISATFMLEKSRFDRDIATLRKRNADLNLLRMHFCVHKKRPWSTKSTTTEAQNKVERLATVRLAGSMLHETSEPDGESSAREPVALRPRNHAASQRIAVSQFEQTLNNLPQRCDDLEAQIHERQQNSLTTSPTQPTPIVQFETESTTPERKYLCMIWCSFFAICASGSMALLLGWGIPNHDIPGGATIAGWIIALAALTFAVFGKKHTSKCQCWGNFRRYLGWA